MLLFRDGWGMTGLAEEGRESRLPPFLMFGTPGNGIPDLYLRHVDFNGLYFEQLVTSLTLLLQHPSPLTPAPFSDAYFVCACACLRDRDAHRQVTVMFRGGS